jgi:chromosome segregation ATPase
MAITQDEVFSVASALREEGKDASVRNVRERLGTGSYSTIARYLREWGAAERDQKVVREEDIPFEVRNVANQFTGVVWQAASEWMSRELAIAKKVAGERVQAAEIEAQGALDEVERLEKQLQEAQEAGRELNAQRDELTAQNVSFKSAIDEVKAQLERERARLSTVEERNHSLSDRVAEEARCAATAEERAKQSEARSQKLEAELQAARALLDQMRESKEKQVKELEDEVRSLRTVKASQRGE